MKTTSTTTTTTKKKTLPPSAPEKRLAKKETTDLSTEIGTGAWGSEGIDNSDILVPKILLMQGPSKFVADEKIEAKMGEFRNSVDATLLASKGNGVDIIVFNSFKTWVIFEEKEGTMEYSKTVPMDATNATWEWEEEINGVKIRRDKTFNFYCILASDVEKGIVFPFVISCRRTSSIAGRKISTIIAKLKAFNKPAAHVVLNLTSTKTENDQGTFYVMDVKEKCESSEKQLAQAYKWYKALQTAKVKIDESDLKHEDVPTEMVGEVQEGDEY